MSVTQKYFYMRLKEDFYDSDSMILLENMENGYAMSTLLLKMYCRSLKREGRLVLSDRIPYSPEMLASVTRMDVEIVKHALQIFQELGLIEILDTGTIYMTDIQNYIGQSSTEADRKREYRERIDAERGGQIAADKCPDTSPPYLDTYQSDIESQRKRESEKTDTLAFVPPTVEDVARYCKEEKLSMDAGRFVDYYAAVGWKIGKAPMCDWKAAVRRWSSTELGQHPQKQGGQESEKTRYGIHL